MSPLSMTLYFLSGIIFLYLGVEGLVQGGASLAIRLRIPTLVIGLTIVGYGTGAPELAVSAKASAAGNGDISLGNVIGSNISNIGLILGICALLNPLKVKKQLIGTDGPIMLVATFLLFALATLSSEIGRWQGVSLLTGLAGYTVWAIYQGRKEYEVLEKDFPPPIHPHKSIFLDLALISGGFIGLFFGAAFFLKGAIGLAKAMSLSDAVIGLTIIAVGTSLPEFATSLIASFKKHDDVALGNIVGSNIFNILGIVGFSAIVQPIHTHGIALSDYVYLTALSAYLCFAIKTDSKLSRREGAFMLLSYAAYIAYLIGRG